MFDTVYGFRLGTSHPNRKEHYFNEFLRCNCTLLFMSCIVKVNGLYKLRSGNAMHNSQKMIDFSLFYRPIVFIFCFAYKIPHPFKNSISVNYEKSYLHSRYFMSNYWRRGNRISAGSRICWQSSTGAWFTVGYVVKC